MANKQINELTELTGVAGGDYVPIYDSSAGGEAKRASVTNMLAVLSSASTSTAGLVELATNAEATTGTDTDRAVTPAALAAVTTALKDLLYPVGTLYFNSENNTNPGSLLGFGTWAAFGAGRVPVGFDSGDTDFNTGEKTGGSKTAAHTHTISHTHTLAHTHTYSGTTSTYTADVPTGGSSGANKGGTHSHTYSGTTSAASTSTTSDSSSANSGSTDVSVVQPYITVYIWKRTA